MQHIITTNNKYNEQREEFSKAPKTPLRNDKGKEINWNDMYKKYMKDKEELDKAVEKLNNYERAVLDSFEAETTEDQLQHVRSFLRDVINQRKKTIKKGKENFFKLVDTEHISAEFSEPLGLSIMQKNENLQRYLDKRNLIPVLKKILSDTVTIDNYEDLVEETVAFYNTQYVRSIKPRKPRADKP